MILLSYNLCLVCFHFGILCLLYFFSFQIIWMTYSLQRGKPGVEKTPWLITGGGTAGSHRPGPSLSQEEVSWASMGRGGGGSPGGSWLPAPALQWESSTAAPSTLAFSQKHWNLPPKMIFLFLPVSSPAFCWAHPGKSSPLQPAGTRQPWVPTASCNSSL